MHIRLKYYINSGIGWGVEKNIGKNFVVSNIICIFAKSTDYGRFV